MGVGVGEIGLAHQLGGFCGAAFRQTDLEQRVLDEGNNRLRRNAYAASHHFTPAKSFCARPLRIVTLSSSGIDSALIRRAHSNVPMS